MRTRKLFLGSLAAGVGLAAVQFLAAKTPKRQNEQSDNLYEVVDAFIAGQMRHLSIPGVALAIVEGSRLVHFRGFGCARPGGEPPTPETPFFIGSVTKSFTALGIMQLVEAGKLELDAPVQCYLPWFHVAEPQASAQMTIRHLLNHTSGLPMSIGETDLVDFDNRPGGLDRMVQGLANQRLSAPIGSKFDYNNANYNILGLIIETVSGESYSDYVQNHIYKPLEMSHSYASKAEAQKNGLAMGYRYWFGFPVPAPNLPIPLSSLPSGQLISCAEDMAHYLITQINGGKYREVQILSSTGAEELHRPAVEMKEMGIYLGHYAMGWMSKVVGQSTIISHGGIVPDFGAFAAFIPQQKKGLVLLYNANHAMMKLSYDEFGMGAAERLAGELPSKTFFGAVPWLMRGMALIPALQVSGVVLTLKRLRSWRADPSSRPSRGRMWRQHILLPLIPNVLLSLLLIPMLGKMRGWLRLFMPDFSWVACIDGSFAAIWAFLRTVLAIHALKRRED
jgi:CubicO group peptidase (beta-lactamase class C family)